MSWIRRFSSVIVGVLGCVVLGAGPATAAEPAITHKWQPIGSCAPTKYAGASICFYYDANNALYALGTFVNHSSRGIQNQGYFELSDGSKAEFCGDVTTAAGKTDACIRKLPAHGSWFLGDTYHYGSGLDTIVTSKHTF